VLGVAFAGLGVVDVLEQDGLIEATLAVLSVLAFALVRERILRGRVDEQLGDIERAVQSVDQTVAALDAGHQYYVANDHAKWEINADDGALAQATRRKEVKVVVNNVLTLLHYSAPTGTEENVRYEVDGRQAPVLQRFHMQGKRYALVFLGRVYGRDEELEFVAHRTLRDVFVDPVNSVSVTTEDVTARLRMTIIWPLGRAPTAVRLERTIAGSAQIQPLPPGLVKDEDGKPTLHFDIPHPERGCRTALAWDWDSVP
jgi:hypothetical protein